MGLGPGQQLLITPSDLLQNGAPSDFMAQFVPGPLQLVVSTGGPLGTMQLTWRPLTDSNASAAIPSEAISPSWAIDLPDPAFCSLTFLTGAYNLNDVYTVSSQGIVTGGTGGGIGLVSATRFDPRLIACNRATSDGVTWLQPRCVAPIVSVGPQIKGWLSWIAVYHLRCRQGVTPPGAGAGDDQLRLNYDIAERELKRIGASQDRPPDIVDSSPGDAGAGFSAYPTSDPQTGW